MNPFKRFFQRDKKESRTMSTLVTSTFGGVSWPEANYDNFARETYLKNIIAFRCI